jgi:glycosyltransferase involved in cell wall biosynthesis
MIIQVGNINSYITGSVSYQESLGEELKNGNIYDEVISVSKYKNKVLRVVDIVLCLLGNSRKTRLVLLHSFSTQAFYISVLVAFLCRVLNIKFVVLTHGGDFPTRIEKSPRLVNFTFGAALITICPSKYLLYHFEKAGFNCRFIPNAVDLNAFPFKERHKFHPNLLWVRSFAKIYNPVMAVEVLEKILVVFPQATLTMVGGKKDSSHEIVKGYIEKKGLEDRVKLTGILSQAEWAKLSQEFDIFINTTNIDNMPLSVLQAMALGLPVFSTNVGGIKYLISDGVNGVKCLPANSDDMAEKIITYLENQNNLTQIAAQAKELPFEYSWANVLPQWEKLISEI